MSVVLKMRIRQITELRNTQKISKLVHESSEPIYITKNGFGDMVVLSLEAYEALLQEKGTPFSKENTSYNVLFEDRNENFGYLKCSCSPIKVQVGNPSFHAEQILSVLQEAKKENISLVVFPELAISSYTAGDLFLNSSFLNACYKAAWKVIKESENYDIFFTFGVPFSYQNHLYNTAFCCYKGKLLGIVPKSFLPNYNEFYEGRYFVSGKDIHTMVKIENQTIPFSDSILFQNTLDKKLVIGVEICEDLWAMDSPSIRHAMNGATVLLNLSASNETYDKENYRRELVSTTSKKLQAAYIYCSSLQEESTTDLLFSGATFIAQDDEILSESSFSLNGATAYIDLNLIENRRRQASYLNFQNKETRLPFSLEMKDEVPMLSKTPFIPSKNKVEIYEKILYMQALSLVKRLKHTKQKKVVLGLSGGLDSTLALLVAVKAMDILQFSHQQIVAISMPCFGTSEKTKHNAMELAKQYQVTFLEISIKASVESHFKDLDLNRDDPSIVFENAQARERTQLLMDYANKVGGIVLGTGDLSEIALGWSTYNGDHMSMYALNASLPKTLIQDMLSTFAEKEHRTIFMDIIKTPISPELLPLDSQGNIKQYTENVLGPYIVHDFFLYHFIHNQFSLKKIYFLAKKAFQKEYDEKSILTWLKIFTKRFFQQQFKRSCMPDGAKIGPVALSPRGDFRLPSDVNYEDFLKELDSL